MKNSLNRQFGIDILNLLQYICDVLEGGVKAFDLRKKTNREKVDRSKTENANKTIWESFGHGYVKRI